MAEDKLIKNLYKAEENDKHTNIPFCNYMLQ